MTGGAGYIGSHVVKLLGDAGHKVTVLDNLSTGRRDAVLSGELLVGDLGDAALLDTVLGRGQFEAVMHFAASASVAESVQNPAKYYSNNVVATVALLKSMLRADVRKFIFSSSAAVYGHPQETPIDEETKCAPINPYGWSKWMVETILRDFARAFGLRYVSFRYFNAAGADPQGVLGEKHEPETHLIPLALAAALGGQALKIFGDD